MCRDRADRGSAAVWLLGLTTLIGLVTAVGVVLGTAMIARHRAEAAADLSALAGAGTLVSGGQDGCGEAARIALRNGAQVTSCVVNEDEIVVTVSRPVQLGHLGVRTATARARAGPAARS